MRSSFTVSRSNPKSVCKQNQTGTHRHVLVHVDGLLQLDVAGWELWIWSLHQESPLKLSDMIFCPVSPLDHSTT